MKKHVIFAIRYSIIQLSASSWETAKLDNNDYIDKILSPTRLAIREKLFEKLTLASLSDLIKSDCSETESTILLMISDLLSTERVQKLVEMAFNFNGTHNKAKLVIKKLNHVF